MLFSLFLTVLYNNVRVHSIVILYKCTCIFLCIMYVYIFIFIVYNYARGGKEPL
nr:MAG TPA: hypothetical protein [Bacteriophage sp.]